MQNLHYIWHWVVRKSVINQQQQSFYVLGDSKTAQKENVTAKPRKASQYLNNAGDGVCALLLNAICVSDINNFWSANISKILLSKKYSNFLRKLIR